MKFSPPTRIEGEVQAIFAATAGNPLDHPGFTRTFSAPVYSSCTQMRAWIIIGAAVGSALCFADDAPLVREGSIGSVSPPIASNAECTHDGVAFRPITCWVGERFLFLPEPKELRAFGYQSFKGGKGQFGVPSYEEATGRIGKVQSVQRGKYGGWEIKMQMEGGREKTYTGESLGGSNDPADASIDGIVPLLDLETARSRWKGKTLWLKVESLVTYDEANGKFGGIKVAMNAPVTVSDVVAGFFTESPIRLILQTSSGVEGFLDVGLSGTNIPSVLRKHARFEDNFSETEPSIPVTPQPTPTHAYEDQILKKLPRHPVTGRFVYSAVVQVPNASATELFSRARAWASRAYVSAKNVTQLDDKEAHRLILKGRTHTTWDHTLIIETREGRFKYTLTDLVLVIDDTSLPKIPLEGLTMNSKSETDGFGKETQVIADEIAASLTAAMKTPEEKW